MNARPEATEVVPVADPPQTGVVVSTDATSLMAVITRAASDPSTDVDKLERLMAMYERITDRNAKAAYAGALAEMQPKLPVINERGGITNRDNQVQSRYAKWEDINDAIRPLLHEHGFALSFRIGRADGTVSVTGVLSHSAGHSEETTLELPVDTGPGRNAVQAVGSSVSYGKRYTAIALLNITSRYQPDRDDDGRNADGGHYITEEKAGDLLAMIEETKADFEGFLRYMGVRAIKDIPAKQFQKAKAALEAKRNGAGRAQR